MDLLPPGNSPAPALGDMRSDFPTFWSADFYPWLSERVVQTYADEASRNADLAGLGPSDTMFAWTADTGTLWGWSGTAWASLAGGDSTWESFDAEWSNNTATALSIGNGSETYRWRSNGRTVHVTGELVRGSTTNTSTAGDHYVWTLPTAARSNNALNGAARVFAGGNVYPCVVYGIGSTSIVLVECATGKRVGNSVSGGAIPAPASGHNYSFTLTYEAAS